MGPHCFAGSGRPSALQHSPHLPGEWGRQASRLQELLEGNNLPSSLFPLPSSSFLCSSVPEDEFLARLPGYLMPLLGSKIHL